jgi:hypothetical protein
VASEGDAVAVHTDAFPEEADVEYEQSIIRIPIYSPGNPPPPKESHEVGWPGEPIEILENDAYMRLERRRPARNYIGHRQFEFQIAEWELIGHSQTLDADVTFTLSRTVQPKSLCRASQAPTDFPAEIYYSAIYDVYVGVTPIALFQAGIAYARDVFSIPPRDVIVAFEKALEKAEMIMGPGCCLGMRSITPEEFVAGRDRAYRARGWPPVALPPTQPPNLS